MKTYNENGIKVKDLKALLNKCPDDAIVLLNHFVTIPYEEKDGKVVRNPAWIFDPIVEAQCETIENCERYPEWKADDKIVWLTHQFE